MSEENKVLELLMDLEAAREKIDFCESEAKEYIREQLEAEDFPVNEVGVGSSLPEFDVLLDRRLGRVAIEELHSLFSGFKLTVLAVDKETSKLRAYFKLEDNAEEGGTGE